MTTQKQNKITLWMQGVFFPVITGLLIACIKFQVGIYGYIERTQVRDNGQDASIMSLEIGARETKSTTSGHETRLSVLEAILPEQKRRKQ